VPLDDEDLDPVLKLRRLHLGRAERPVAAERRLLRAVEGDLRGAARLLRVEADEEAVARVEVAVDGGADALGRGAAEAREVGAELAGVAEEDVVLVEEVRLAAEAADALQARDETELPLGAGAFEFGRRRPLLGEARDLVGHDLLDLAQRRAGPRRHPEGEEAGQLLPALEAGRVGGELAVVDERAVEAGREAVNQNRGGEVQLGVARVEVGGRVPAEVGALLRDAVVDLDDLLAVEPHRAAGRAVERGAGRDGAEVFLDEALGLGRVEVAGDDEREVVRRVVGAEELAHVVERGGREVFVEADDVGLVGVARRVEVLHEELEPAAVGLIFEPLPALVLDHVALVVELLFGQRVGERGEAVGLDPEEVFEVARGHGGEVVGAILVGRAVDAALEEVRAGGLDVLEILARRVLRALEHHVLEEVREAAAARPLVLRADVEPLVDVDDRQLAVDVQDDAQPVGQRVLLELNLRHGARLRRRRAALRLAGGGQTLDEYDEQRERQREGLSFELFHGFGRSFPDKTVCRLRVIKRDGGGAGFAARRGRESFAGAGATLREGGAFRQPGELRIFDF
jgi:hypothetical protein